MQNLIKVILWSLTFIFISGCQPSVEDKNTLKIGTISGPEAELMQTASQVALRDHGLKVKIIEFSDYLQPNAALNDGSINANMFQHQPYLDQQIKDKHYPLVAVGKTFVYPMGIYSTKVKDIHAIQPANFIAIPNDPSNEGRALLLLEKAKLIKLRKNAGLYATPHDIIENPKQLKFKEMDAAQLTRALPDVDLAVINTNYAVAAGLFPSKDAIFIEGKDSPYANIIVIRKDELNDPRIKQLVSSIQSKDVLEMAKTLFQGEAIKAW